MEHSGIETDGQSPRADMNSSLVCLSLTDEGSEFIKETNACPSGRQPGHTVIPWFREQENSPNFQRTVRSKIHWIIKCKTWKCRNRGRASLTSSSNDVGVLHHLIPPNNVLYNFFFFHLFIHLLILFFHYIARLASSSLCSPGCPQTHNPPAFTFLTVGIIGVWYHIQWTCLYFFPLLIESLYS